jgi:diacylglycerol kinase family enzyme
MRRRFLIVHNAYAGTRRRWLLRAVCRYLHDAGAKVQIEEAENVEQDQKITRSAVETGAFDAVVAAGGDSTVRAAASALIGSAIPLGIIPLGTGNVLAREINIGWSPKALADYLLHGPSVGIKCGLADDTPFLMMAGVGYDADVLLRLSTPWKRSVGRFAYAWPIIRETFRKPRQFDVVVDDRLLPATWLIATRAAHYGGSFIIAGNQTLASDGFHAVIVNTRNRRSLAAVLVSIALGRHENRGDVIVMPCTHLTIKPSGLSAAQIDGERMASPPSEIKLSHESLNLIVPQWSALATVGARASEHCTHSSECARVAPESRITAPASDRSR